jgi:YVTN family beta-propeller protein
VGAGTLGRTSYVVNSISGTLTPITAGRAGRPISVGLYAYPTAVSFTGTTAVVLDTYAGQVSLVDTASRHVLKSVNVGGYPQAVAISG